MGDTYDGYKTKAFIDSNVILEAKRLPDLPWTDVDPIGPILVLILPTVMEEVDRKKRDGRLAQRAREFNRLLAPLVSGASVIRLTDAPIQVDLAIADCERVDWDRLADLDPQHGDHRVVAELLHVLGVPAIERVIVGQDIKPLILAKRHGIKAIHVSDAWLPPPEPSPLEKEVGKLKRQLREYERTEPEFDVRFEVVQPVPICAVKPLEDEEVDTLITRILDANPQPHQPSMSFMTLGVDGTLSDRYDKYANERLPAFIQSYSQKLELMFGQTAFSLRVENTGNVRADKALIRVRIVGGWFNDKPILVPVEGPLPPRARQYDPMRMPRFVDNIASRVGKHEFDVDAPRREATFEAQCEDFRHGTRWNFDGVVWLDPNFSGECRVVVEVTAANRHGTFSRTIPIQRTIEHVTVADLVNQNGQYGREAPIRPVIDKLAESEDYSEIEVDGGNSDD